MTFSGKIADFSLTEIIQTIGSSGRTGQLVIDGRIVKISVIFRDGQPVRTIPEYMSVMLGQLLIRGKEVDPVGLITALTIQKSHKKIDDDKRLGCILLDLGLIDQETLNKYLSIQLRDSFYDILSEKEGTFEFISMDIQPDIEDLFSLNIVDLILHGMRYIETRARIKEIISSDDVVLKKNSGIDSTDIGLLGTNERMVFFLVDGIKSITDILNSATSAQLNVLEALYQLIKKSYIKIPQYYQSKSRR